MKESTYFKHLFFVRQEIVFAFFSLLAPIYSNGSVTEIRSKSVSSTDFYIYFLKAEGKEAKHLKCMDSPESFKPIRADARQLCTQIAPKVSLDFRTKPNWHVRAVAVDLLY